MQRCTGCTDGKKINYYESSFFSKTVEVNIALAVDFSGAL
jgi:hypothetical protein